MTGIGFLDSLIYMLGLPVFSSSNVTIVILFLVSLAVSCVLYTFFVARHRSEHLGWKGFFEFSRLWGLTFFRFVYIFVSVTVLVFGIWGSIVTILSYASSGLGVIGSLREAMLWIVRIAAALIVIRIAFELILIPFRVCEDVRLFKSNFDASLNAVQQSSASAQYEQPISQRQYVPVEETALMPAVGIPRTEVLEDIAPKNVPSVNLPGNTEWDCSCGSVGNTGAFCGSCGAARA